MATVKFGAGIIQMSGSIAGVTHARNRFGNYIRPRTKPVNPNSTGQQLIRTAIGLLSQKWHDTLTPAQRIAWNTYAAAIAMKNRLGETIYITGFNHYIRSNSVRIHIGLPQCPEAPTVLALPEKDPALELYGSAGTQLLTITFNDTLPWTNIAGSALCLWLGQPQLHTRNFFNGPWKYTGKILETEASPQTKAPSYTLVLGQKIWLYARISTGPTDSRLSEPFIQSITVVA